MPNYVDGFVLPVPKKKLKAYLKIARAASVIFKEHGALEYRECVGEDLNPPVGLSFPKGIRSKPSEAIIFAYVVYQSKAHRNRVNARAMKDPRLGELCKDGKVPFDCDRMLYGGFKTIVEA